MIKKLTIGGVASYKTPVEIDNLGCYNFFYGLNGSGKTTITRFLAKSHEERKSHQICKIELSTKSPKPDILVYNSDYVERNFYEPDGLNGVFTLDETNKEAWEAINKANAEILDLESRISEWNEQINGVNLGDRIIKGLQNEINDMHKDVLDRVWKVKGEINNPKNKFQIYELLSPFNGDKGRFYNELIKVDLPKIGLEDNGLSFGSLEKEYEKLLKADGVQRPTYNQLEWTEVSDEVFALLQQRITSTQDSYLSELIQRLSHEDWVRKGVTYLDEVDECPFCRQEINTELKKKIKNHFDDIYKQKMLQVQNAKSSYEQETGKIIEALDSLKGKSDFINSATFVRVAADIKEKINMNVVQLSNKIENPNLSIQIAQLQDHVCEINAIIGKANREIEDQNERAKNTQELTNLIRKKLWDLLRHRSNEIIIKYETDLKSKNEMLQSLVGKVEAAQTEIGALKDEIESNNAKVKNIDNVVESINRRLHSFGFDGFQIVKTKSDDNLPKLKISRNDDDCSDSKFESLSEGEKTLISFLYFVEECVGARGDENSADPSKRIIVIDDPISSLSFNLVFGIASLVRKEFLTKIEISSSPVQKAPRFCQVFIFTHHLYFFHEVIPVNKMSNSNNKLFRIYKNDAGSQVGFESEFSINNNYDEYWMLLREIKAKRLTNTETVAKRKYT